MVLIQPVRCGKPLLDEIQQALRCSDRLFLWWLGQSGFLLVYQGRSWLIDPYLSDSLTKKYSDTDKPHIRMTGQCIEPSLLNFVDVVSSSHNHTDHLDAETLVPLLDDAEDTSVLVPLANIDFVAERLQVSSTRLTPINAGQTLSLKSFRVTAVPAAHDELQITPSGAFPYLGYVIHCGEIRLFHSGDTIPYPSMIDWLRPLKIDIAILPINGRKPARRVAGNLWGDEAAELAHAIGAQLTIPCHYDMFTFNTEPTDLFVNACREQGLRHKVLQCGEQLQWPNFPTTR